MSDYVRSRTYDEFYRRYFPVIRRYAFSRFGPRDADDVAQEVMARALVAYPGVDQADPLPWLRTVAFRIGVDNVRRRRRTTAVPSDSLAAAIPPQPDDAVERAVVGDTRRRLRAAMRELSQREQDALLLRHVHGYAEAEVGRALGLNPNAARQLTWRARRALRRAYRATGGPERLAVLAPASASMDSAGPWWRSVVPALPRPRTWPVTGIVLPLTISIPVAVAVARAPLASSAVERVLPAADRSVPVVAMQPVPPPRVPVVGVDNSSGLTVHRCFGGCVHAVLADAVACVTVSTPLVSSGGRSGTVCTPGAVQDEPRLPGLDHVEAADRVRPTRPHAGQQRPQPANRRAQRQAASVAEDVPVVVPVVVPVGT